MTKKEKEQILQIKQLEGCNNKILVKDILKIILINKKHHNGVLKVIKKIGIKKENSNKVDILLRKLSNIPNVYIKNNGAIIYYKSQSL